MALILLGKSCSGKDTIRNELINLGMKPVVAYTTRPARPGEVDGVTYHFVSEEDFKSRKLDAVRKFNVAHGQTWYYGQDFAEVTDNSVVIVDPSGLKDYQTDVFIDAVSFYIKVPEEILFTRAINRGGDTEEIERRIKADNRDFQSLESKVDYVIQNARGNVKKTAKAIYDLYWNTVW